MRYRLIGAHGSGSSFIEGVLRTVGADYDLERIDVRAGGLDAPTFRALNPIGKLPVLVTPEGAVWTESAAIALSLAARYPEAGLLPADPDQRAWALRWLLFAVTELYTLAAPIDHPERLVEDPACADGVRRVGMATWRARWQLVEATAMGEGPYLLGEAFCVTDVFLAMMSRWDLPAAWRAEHTPRVDRLARAVRARPGLDDVFARNFRDG